MCRQNITCDWADGPGRTCGDVYEGIGPLGDVLEVARKHHGWSFRVVGGRCYDLCPEHMAASDGQARTALGGGVMLADDAAMCSGQRS